MRLRLEPQLISHTMGLASNLVDAQVLFYECPDTMTGGVLCVDLPRARLCGTFEAAKEFFEHKEEKKID